jgi:hypothetical protein
LLANRELRHFGLSARVVGGRSLRISPDTWHSRDHIPMASKHVPS